MIVLYEIMIMICDIMNVYESLLTFRWGSFSVHLVLNATSHITITAAGDEIIGLVDDDRLVE